MTRLASEHVTEERPLERDELRAERDALLAAQRLRDETIALVVHDMKNPLAGVLSNAEYLISSQGLSTDQSECANDILAAARRLHRQVLSLLDLNLREHGTLVPDRSVFDLVELIDHVLSESGALLADKALRWARTGDPGPAVVRADHDMFARLIANLIENAARSSPQAGEITIELIKAPHQVELRVTDRGARFSPEHRSQLFETYVAANETLRRARKGRFLGLASCRAIAEAHGGSIRLQDAEPEGSTFCVLLPAAPPSRIT